MDPVWIALAFILGFAVRQVGLPPLVGFAVFGMGRVGTGAYDAMRERYGDIVIGIDYDAVTVREHQAAGRNVIHGDATDPDFWERAKERRRGKVRLVMLAMPRHTANMYAAKEISARSRPDLFVAATAQFRDEIEALKLVGSDCKLEGSIWLEVCCLK